MSCDYDQSSVEFRFGFSHEQDWRALTGTGHSVVLHCLGSARLICHEIYQFGYFKERGGHAIGVRKRKVYRGVD